MKYLTVRILSILAFGWGSVSAAPDGPQAGATASDKPLSKPAVVLNPDLRPEILDSPARETPGLLDKMLAGPLKDIPAVVCVLKNEIGGGGIEGDFGWTLHGHRGIDPKGDGLSFTERQSHIIPSPKFGGGPSRLVRIDLRTREVTTLYEEPNGGVMRDPVVFYDGTKILFSMRKAGEIRYHLYEVTLNSPVGATSAGNLRQITDRPDDEIEPIYLPDGDILYASGKPHRFTPCNAHVVANLYRCNADGKNSHRLTNGMDAERTPWVLPDGRIAFAKWCYTHRDQTRYLGLWVMNPDGSKMWILSGNKEFYSFGWPGYAKPIPNTNKLVCSVNYAHSTNGPVATIDPTRGPYNVEGVSITSLGNPVSTFDLVNRVACDKYLWKDDERNARLQELGPDGRTLSHLMTWTDPYPISEDCFLVTNFGDQNELCVMDGKGNYEVIVTLPKLSTPSPKVKIEDWEVEPEGFPTVLAGVRPLVPRKREPIIPVASDLTKTTATMMMADIYQGMRFGDVPRGSIKGLRVMENLAQPMKYVADQGISLGEMWTSSRYWGTVPVEPDGSAHFEVPAMRSLAFIAVDDQNREVKYMRTQLSAAPGEVASCMGCHEDRKETYPPISWNLLAFKRPPSQLMLPAGVRHVPVSYTKDIQPILDRNCVSCHNIDKPEGRIILEGHRTPKWSVAYVHLMSQFGEITTAGSPRDGDEPVRPMMAATSRLMEQLKGGYHGVQATPEEIETVRIWINEDAAYQSASLGNYAGRMHPQDPVPAFDGKVLTARCDSCHVNSANIPVPWDGKPVVDKSGRYAGQGAWPMGETIYGSGRGESLINLDYPDKSLLLRAPLSKAAGGLGWCLKTDARSKKGGWELPEGEPAEVFLTKDDPDFQKLLNSIVSGSDYFKKNIRRFDMPGYQPNAHLVRFYKSWGIIPKDYDVSKEGWDVEKLDEIYNNHGIMPDGSLAPGPRRADGTTQ